MATLYDLTGQFLNIYQMDIDEDTKLDTIESMGLIEDLEDKAEGYAKVIRNLEADKASYKVEKERFAAKEKAVDNKIKLLKTNLQTAMELTGLTKIDGELFNLSLQKTKDSVIIEEDKLPKKYWNKKVTEIPDKKGLYDLLKEGKKIKGASLQENRSLRIR
ncbi:siphovirus Gp157 family protein [Streptococcus danieliae]|uniref:siphovirus Gp157 family protein n=1 Tax=Streptococcus danieliae TaxID=747656 RepID=UPI0021C910D1|nr:siphovirus Gp157 family protein [Streptococcus danieliae]MCU0082591.1 siphovirus Gp157 family protein [Streptococcus danieliae]